MDNLKSKSLVSHISDEDIDKGCITTRFITFESAINFFRKEFNLMGEGHNPLGYVITDQGIRIIYD